MYRFAIVVVLYVQKINLGRLQLSLFFLLCIILLFQKSLTREMCYPDPMNPICTTMGLWNVLLLLVEVVGLPVVYDDGEWAPEGD